LSYKLILHQRPTCGNADQTQMRVSSLHEVAVIDPHTDEV
jgi:hypothetical protein